MKHYRTIGTLLYVLSMPLSLLAPTKDASAKILPDEFDKSVYEWTKPFTETLHAVRNKYYKTVDPKNALIKATKTLINTLDPHSDFVDAEEFKQIQEATQGEFFGIGVIIDNTKSIEQEYLTIIDIVPGGPAEKSGLRAQDKIVEVSGATLKGLTVEEIIRKLKGKKGEKVHIKIQRSTSAELIPFDITRDVVKDQNALCFYFKEHNIFYLSLNMFTENSTKQIEQLLKKSKTNHAKGLILDLRNNSGGLLSAAVDIAGLFLEKGSVVVSTKNRDGQTLDTYKTTREPLDIGAIPIIILVNNFTASAAEILAGCLRAHAEKSSKKSPHMIFIVGSKTFGKGSVQEVIPTCNDCAIKLTTALYYLPDNTSLQSVGIQPDFIIHPRFSLTKDMAWFNKFFGQESALKNAIAHEETSGNEKEKPAKDEKEKTPQERRIEQIGSDYLVLSSVRLLNMFDLARNAYPKQTHTRKDAITLLKTIYNPDDEIKMQEIECSATSR